MRAPPAKCESELSVTVSQTVSVSVTVECDLQFLLPRNIRIIRSTGGMRRVYE